MSTHVTSVVLTAGEPLSGVWTLTDEDTSEPVTPALVTAAAFRAGMAELVDWSQYATAGTGTASLDVPGSAFVELGEGQWAIQVWAALDPDAVPDVLVAQINARVYVGHPDPTMELEVSGVVT